MVAKGKKTAAHQHDKRHENGNAAPGKRITKQKSSSQLNGHANGRPQASTPPLPSQVDDRMTQPASAHDSASGSSVHHTTMAAAACGAAEERARASSDASLDNGDACRLYDTGSGPFDPMPPSALRRLDGNASKSVSMASILSVPATILTSCPLRDVLAILIILLQLPPTVLTVVQFLFATLTFVPPQAGTPLSALSAFPSFTDIFQGSGGTPSLFTTIFADALILVVWLILWVPVQNFFLDLAQAVIAIALGGAAAGKNGTTNSIFICFIIILSNHLFRFRPLRQHIVHFVWTGLSRGGLEFLTSPPSSPTTLESFSSPHGWLRSILGIHILAQGVVRIIRRSLSRRDAAPTLPTGKKTDPEAGVLQRANSTTLDPNADVPNSSSTDGRPPGPSPAAHSKTDKTSSTRRKRKQATHVRSQQPFWAALASTKVTVLKEMESSRAANDADEANAKDANHIGNAVWRSEDDRVWVSEVGYSDISFRVNLFTGIEFQEQDEEDLTTGSGIDKSKPFYIRVNGADWSSTRIRQSTSLGYQGQEGTGFWVGEIFGLTALSNYYCEFVRTVDNEVFYSASLITSAGPVAELASVASPPAHQTLRPSSPTTTLKNSIAAADQQLQEQRNRLKRAKKDHKTAIGTIRKEVDSLSNRLANAGGSDERQRQRVLQFTQNIRQAEDAAADFSLQADNLGEIPEEEVQEAAAKKAAWKKERDNKNAIASEFDNVKAEIERQIQSVETDIAGTLRQRERLQQRQTRLNEQHDRLVTANAEGFTAKQRKEQERTALRQQRAEIENQYRSNINGYERRTEDANLATGQMMQTIHQYEELILAHNQHHMSVPTTPEGPLPGTGMSPNANPFASFTFPSIHSHVNSTPGSLRGGRGRSSSMLSNISGFTDGFDEPYSPSGYTLGNPFNAPLNGHNGSHGSGSLSSGTSSQSSSQRDPMSPVQPVKPMMVRSAGSAGLMSPIGTGR
ncbi:hypothetical protein HBI56_202810 [Parastagonospora nodorum]|nr:hypothetical protein HBI95_215690 [Parastagonospora nodorum]KAH4344607.1 hypothetical protein HBH98_134600 [Parastagonospora nodorum]KAH4373818.1 hypothetical protein HBH97_125900 [Parastagonospora nodorum]KAH4421105.1 hypothetical protein HBH99_052180 [Parastagonospora nodorum]KAH4899693.1 hypothetical protein HBI80_164710 [Parastagonospora nodorum]